MEAPCRCHALAAPWLGQRLRLRKVPQLSLRRDDSIESGDRVLRILRELDGRGGRAHGGP